MAGIAAWVGKTPVEMCNLADLTIPGVARQPQRKTKVVRVHRRPDAYWKENYMEPWASPAGKRMIFTKQKSDALLKMGSEIAKEYLSTSDIIKVLSFHSTLEPCVLPILIIEVVPFVTQPRSKDISSAAV